MKRYVSLAGAMLIGTVVAQQRPSAAESKTGLVASVKKLLVSNAHNKLQAAPAQPAQSFIMDDIYDMSSKDNRSVDNSPHSSKNVRTNGSQKSKNSRDSSVTSNQDSISSNTSNTSSCTSQETSFDRYTSKSPQQVYRRRHRYESDSPERRDSPSPFDVQRRHRRDSPSPDRRDSPSPFDVQRRRYRYESDSPYRKDSPSPFDVQRRHRRDSPSPDRRDSPSPFDVQRRHRRDSPSPDRRDSPSPFDVQRRHRRDSPSPDRSVDSYDISVRSVNSRNSKHSKDSRNSEGLTWYEQAQLENNKKHNAAHHNHNAKSSVKISNYFGY